MKKKILFAVVILLLLSLPQGCQSLTGRMWHKPEMVSKESKLRVYKLWHEKNDISKLYIEYRDLSDMTRFIEINVKFFDWDGKIKPFLPKNSNLKLWDFSRVPHERRVIAEYHFIVLREDNRRQYADGEKRFKFDDIEVHFLGYIFTHTASFIDSLPKDIVKIPESTIDSAELTEWHIASKDTIFDKSIKIVLTPFTLVADVILVPTCHGYMWIYFMYEMRNFRS